MAKIKNLLLPRDFCASGFRKKREKMREGASSSLLVSIGVAHAPNKLLLTSCALLSLLLSSSVSHPYFFLEHERGKRAVVLAPSR